MGLITTEVEVLMNNSRQVAHYRKMGYSCHKGDILTVPIEHLPPTTGVVRVDVLCDGCKKKILHPTFSNYNLVMGKCGRYMCEGCSTSYGLRNRTPEEIEASNKKREETNLKLLGYKWPTQSPKVQEKIVKSAFEKGLVRSSAQQNYICDLYNGCLNGVISRYNCDIVLEDEKICIEYDGRGHDMRVRLGAMTQEEFNIKEIVREKTIRKAGYKQIHIISITTDKIPTDEVLLQMLKISKQYFKDNPERSWINWDIDKGIYRNALNKEGVLFDYGELHAIKKSNIDIGA